MEKKGYSLLQVIIIIVVTSIISGITIGVIFIKGTTNDYGVSYSDLLTDKNVKEFLDVYSEVVDEYYTDVNKEEIIENAINGMMDYLDETYTTHLDENEASSLMQQLNGTYEGIGITFKDNEVINVVMNSPAEKAGILSGDIIISVNGDDILGKTSEEIVELIKQNTESVLIGVERNGTPMVFSMKVETLKIPSVSYRMIDNSSIGYIQMTVFSNNLNEEVTYALANLKKQNVDKLIIDLRSNSGGYLDQAYKTSSLFLKKGKVIYSLSGKSGTEEFADNDNVYENYPIVILVNGATASAAEILTAALKDSYGAVIVGTKTYGKGKVQHTYSLHDGGLVKYTTSKWLRPNGVCIDGIGITPDHVVQNEYIYDDTNPEMPIITGVIDKQLEKAVELLRN